MWATWSDERLLRTRLCDLALTIKGTPLAGYIRQLYAELAAHDLVFRPHFWLSDDWYTPDGVPGTAIPFYMAHPRLARLEESQMLEVEGGTPEWCMQILRHEAGHAIENAYGLRRRRRRVQLFGRSSVPYPKYYTPRPYSRSFVLHLDSWYAQSHPDEDFAETFAVWLRPDANWEARYAGWPALKKLRYVDELVRELAGRRPRNTVRRRIDPQSRLTKTLGEHYQERRSYYGVDTPDDYDRHLRRLFSNAPELRGNVSAARFIARVRKDVRKTVARWTGEYQYRIKEVIDHLIERCRALGLRLRGSEEQAKLDFTVFLVVQTMHYIHSGQHRVWL